MSSDPDHHLQLVQRLSDEVRAGQRATAIIDDLVNELMGVNATDGRCLDLLGHLGQMSAGELARASGLTTGAITGVVDRLERAGYARRVADPADRRRVLIEPTQKAHDASWELFGPFVELARPMLGGYSDEQLELLIEFQRLGRELQEHHAEHLRERLATGRARPHPETRTERGSRAPSRRSRS
jgi:DNA-binding MarR family transcriptional regulator